MSFARTSVTWPRVAFDVALESMDCEGELLFERVSAKSEREAREIARGRQDEPERWCVVDVRLATTEPSLRGAA